MEVKLFIVSFLVGLVDSIPGVSGGTVAFVGGIYDRLLSMINAVSHTRSFHDIKRYDWQFICIFVPMVLVGAFIMFSVIATLLEYYHSVVYAVFAVVLLLCVVYVFLSEKLELGHIFTLLIASIPFYYVSGLTLFIGELSLVTRAMVGIVSGVAMLLPGVSGSFMLLMFGQYEFVSGAVKHFDILYILPFAIGFIVGVMLCSAVVTRLLAWDRKLVVSILLGVMVGTIPVLLT